MSRICTRFGATTTADEVVAGIDLHGKQAIVTGGASGIGFETAFSLARAGADVALAVRDTAVGRQMADRIGAATGRPVDVRRLDLLDRSTISAFISEWQGPLHLLINNAGVMACPLARTAEGWESQFATNHLGHFTLALGLHEALAAAGTARIVSVSSSGHLASPIVFDDIHFEHRPYDPWKAYGQSKTANVLFAVEATRRWASDGIVANALMPGGIMTRLQRHVPQATKDRWMQMQQRGEFKIKTPQQGASTTLVAAVSPEFEQVGGRYLEDGNEALMIANDVPADSGVREWALNADAATLLWERSLEMLGEPA